MNKKPDDKNAIGLECTSGQLFNGKMYSKKHNYIGIGLCIVGMSTYDRPEGLSYVQEVNESNKEVPFAQSCCCCCG